VSVGLFISPIPNRLTDMLPSQLYEPQRFTRLQRLGELNRSPQSPLNSSGRWLLTFRQSFVNARNTYRISLNTKVHPDAA
jgi:hypothetical protein